MRKAHQGHRWASGWFRAHRAALLVCLCSNWLQPVRTNCADVPKSRITLRDFARGFFAAGPKPLVVKPYTFSNLIAALNTVAPFSWRGYLLTQLNAHDGAYLQDDLKRAGYSLIFGATETSVFARRNKRIA